MNAERPSWQFGGMNADRTVFSQIMALLPLKQFHRCVDRYQGEHKVKSFSCLDQFLTLAFAQLTYRESLRDIEACLRAVQPRLYHMGFRCPQISRNTLAHANEQRDWRIYADFAQILIAEARTLYAGDDSGLSLQETVFALDSTVIDLCLALFPWAPYQCSKAALKLHTLLDLRGSIPTYLHVTGARTSDVSVLDHLPLHPGAIYIMDRGYVHFKRLYALAQAAVFFLVRARANMQFRRRASHPIDKSTGLRSDQTIVLTGDDSAQDYPAPGAASTSSTRNIAWIWSSSPICSRSPPSPSPSFIRAAGRSNCSSNGSNSICASKPFTVPRPMPSKSKSGWRSASTCSWPS